MLKGILRYVSAANKFELEIARRQKRVLFRIGGYARKVFITSIKSAQKKSSTPGTPPVRHVAARGGLQYVLFDVSMQKQSVLIGVQRTFPKMPRMRKYYSEAFVSSKPTPKLLNESGVSTRTRVYYHSGQTYVDQLRFQQFPISVYPPTVQVIDRKFAEILRSEGL